MPIIRIEMFEGRSLQQKRELVQVFTRELSRICGTPADGIHVVIDEVSKDNWAIGGSLYADRGPDNKSSSTC